MVTITIPKNLIKNDDLVVLPRKEYEAFLLFSKKPTKKNIQLDKDLKDAILEYKAGKFHGPFDNVEDLMKSLKSKK